MQTSDSESSTFPTEEYTNTQQPLITRYYPSPTHHVHVQAESDSEVERNEDAHSSQEGRAPSSNNTSVDDAPKVEQLLTTLALAPVTAPTTVTLRRSRSVGSNSNGSTGRARSLPRRIEPTEEEDNEVDVRILNPVEVRQLQTRQALRQLKSPPNTQTWTPEHHDILSENVKILLDATRDPSELPDTIDDDDDHTRGRNTLTPGLDSNQRTKRSRSRSRSRSAKKQKVPAPTETAEAQLPLRRLPQGLHARVPGNDDDLIKLNPQPVQMWFSIHPLEDRTDEWFVQEFRVLFRNLEGFFDNYFCIHNLDEGEFHQPWAANHTPEFLSYVLQVAEADPNGGGWDEILRDTNQRKWLLVGIMMTILENKVFSEDLWGATKEGKELMFGIEKALFTQEGFARTKLRAEAVRTILGPGPVTTDFHTEVAKLTAQVYLLFKPLVDFMYALPQPDGANIPNLWDQYQDLHNVISHAAYLSLCIRLSPTIFYFTPLSPGDAFQPDDQHCLETQVFTESKAKVVSNYDEALKIWIEKKPKLEQRITELKTNKLAATKKVMQAVDDLKEYETTNPKHYGYSYRAMTKVCAWPNIRRFKPGSLEQEQANTPQELMTGFRIYEVSKSAAVMYFGTEDRAERVRQNVCLRGWVGEKQKEYGAKVKERGMARAMASYALVGIVMFAALPVYAFAESFREMGVTEALAGLAGLAERFRGGSLV